MSTSLVYNIYIYIYIKEQKLEYVLFILFILNFLVNYARQPLKIAASYFKLGLNWILMLFFDFIYFISGSLTFVNPCLEIGLEKWQDGED